VSSGGGPAGWVALLALVLIAGPVASQQPVANHDPDAAQLVTDDIPRFWAALDGATLLDAADRFQHLYIEPGTPGLKAFLRGRIVNGRALAGTVAARPRYYAAIRSATLAVDTAARVKARIRASFHRLADLYAAAVFPDVYFVVGRLNSGGTAGEAGLIIGTEMYARDLGTPTDELTPWEKAVVTSSDVLPNIVAHELIHFQQPDGKEPMTLLAQALREGSADFLGQLISGGIINRLQHQYGDAHEAELWDEFRPVMHGRDVSDWMYQGDKSVERPPDLGYYIGYRITQAYYDRAADKRAAIAAIINETNADQFLTASGYDGGRDREKAVKEPR